MREREVAGARDALEHHRRADEPRQIDQLRDGVAVRDRVAREDQRPFRAREELGGLRHRAGHRLSE